MIATAATLSIEPNDRVDLRKLCGWLLVFLAIEASQRRLMAAASPHQWQTRKSSLAI